jgi:YbgC/YbaW family acyl-CoA thioester hydrolase
VFLAGIDMTHTSNYELLREVAFSDTDMAGLVHFPNYLRYVEDTEYSFLRSAGLDVILDAPEGKLGFPRTHIECDYAHPARYRDQLRIALYTTIVGGKTIEHRFQIYTGEKVVVRGLLTTACCRFLPDKDPYAIPIPDFIIDKLVAAGANQ